MANLPAGTRAVQLPDNSYNSSSYFLQVFGRPDSASACSCERSQDASLAQSLHLLNSKDIQAKLTAEKGRAALLAADRVTGNDDGYGTHRNNYRIYHDPKTDKLTFIPSGMDQMFGDTNWPITPGWGGSVAAAVMNTKEGKKRYLARLQVIMRDVYKPGELVARLDELEAVVQPALAGVDPGAGRGYRGQVDRLRNAIKERARNINEQIKRLPPEK